MKLVFTHLLLWKLLVLVVQLTEDIKPFMLPATAKIVSLDYIYIRFSRLLFTFDIFR